LLKPSSSNIADDDDNNDVTMATDPSSVPDVDNLMSVCQSALDDEIHKMNEVSLCVCVCVSPSLPVSFASYFLKSNAKACSLCP